MAKAESAVLTLRLQKELYEQLSLKAQQENSDLSKCCRRIREKGVSVEAYKDDIDFLTKIIRNELEAIIEPYGNRQIKMLMKVGKASGGTMFTVVKLLLTLLNSNELHTFKELLESAMKLKDFEVDNLITDSEEIVTISKSL